MNKFGKSFFNMVFVTFGTVLLVILVTVSAINFSKDSRSFQKPQLSAAANANTAQESTASSKSDDGYATLKYQKKETPTPSPSPSVKPKPSAKPSPKPSSTPTPTPEP